MNQLKSEKTFPIRAGEELDKEALANYLKENVPEVGPILNITQFPGGFSNLTYCLHTENIEYVLRRPPAGANIKGGHDMGREFRVLSLLKSHYKKIPNPLIYCESAEIIGVPFYVMEKIQGIILRPSNAVKLQISAEIFQNIGKSLIDNLVNLHALDIQKTGLSQLGKPEGYVQRQVEGWVQRYQNAETEVIENMNQVGVWMKNNQPTEQSPAFLHNDYKYDNVILNPDNLSEILGVLDWEMATVGDPLMDLGATLAYWIEPNDAESLKLFNLTWLPGNLTRQEVVEHYTQKSGRDLSNILFYYVFGLYKNAVIVQQIYARWKKGFTNDTRFGGLLPVIIEMANKAAQTIEKGKI